MRVPQCKEVRSVNMWCCARQAFFFFFNAFFSVIDFAKATFFFQKSAFFFNSHPSSFYLPLFSGRFRSRESVRPIRIKWREQIVVGPLMRENIGRCLLFGLFFIFSKIFLISFFFSRRDWRRQYSFWRYCIVCIFIFLFILSTFSFWFSCRS